MNKEDDEIKKIFAGFEPDISPDNAFMNRLLRNMEMVEDVKRQNLVLRKNNKIAMAVASLVGFVVGIVFTLVSPYVTETLSMIQVAMSLTTEPLIITTGLVVISYALIGLISLVMIRYTYTTTFSLLRKIYSKDA
jgi:tetrahydromethanopterin S-methyltransferase subunit F